MDGREYNLGAKLVFISFLFFFFYLDLYFVYCMMIIIFSVFRFENSGIQPHQPLSLYSPQDY